MHILGAGDHVFGACLGQVHGPAAKIAVFDGGNGLIGDFSLVVLELGKGLLALSPDVSAMPAGCVSDQGGK